MQKSRWIIASVAIVGMMGFGHAGCYTSGIPGGAGFGGTTNAGGSSSSLGGSAAGGGDGGIADADTDAEVPQCANSSECPGGQLCDTSSSHCVDCTQDIDCTDPSKPLCDTSRHTCVRPCKNSFDCQKGQLCDTSSKQCVDCTQDSDCISDPNKSYCDTSRRTCVACLPTVGCTTNQRCVSSECISKTNCSSDVTCGNLQPAQICGSENYCVECTDTVPCQYFDPGQCGNNQCTCSKDGLCLFSSSGQRVAQADAG